MLSRKQTFPIGPGHRRLRMARVAAREAAESCLYLGFSQADTDDGQSGIS